MHEQYLDTVKEAVEYLEEIRKELFTKAINVEMFGDLSEVHKAFEVGDSYHFTMEHLENSKDNNVERLVKLINDIDWVINRTIFQNNL